MSRLRGLGAFAVLLLAPVAWGQQCQEKCSESMGACVVRCNSGDAKCTNGCTRRLTDCNTRCGAQPLKTSKCVGANGKQVPCTEYTNKVKEKPTPEDPNEEYPNKAAKDLAKDPAFKDLMK